MRTEKRNGRSSVSKIYVANYMFYSYNLSLKFKCDINALLMQVWLLKSDRLQTSDWQMFDVRLPRKCIRLHSELTKSDFMSVWDIFVILRMQFVPFEVGWKKTEQPGILSLYPCNRNPAWATRLFNSSFILTPLSTCLHVCLGIWFSQPWSYTLHQV